MTRGRTGALLSAALTIGLPLAIFPPSTAQDDANQALISEGARLFSHVWTVAEGLGPTFNARSCAGCHATPVAGGSGIEIQTFVLVMPTLPSGSRVVRRLRVDRLGAVSEEPAPRGAVLRKTPALFGSGLIEAIPAPEIGGSGPTGRFGWKARFHTIQEAVTSAFENELGLQPEEVSADKLNAVSAFIRSLPPLSPISVAGSNDDEERGRALFREIGCITCHVPSFPSLGAQKLSPYTDLLLHDMGPALADGIVEGTAKPTQFKTPPLWGISRTGPPYLHDGRASTLEQAIGAHAGEASDVVRKWTGLPAAEKARLLAFVQSL
jgi:CxxC motif-containing protein (DUF1111 family)